MAQTNVVNLYMADPKIASWLSPGPGLVSVAGSSSRTYNPVGRAVWQLYHGVTLPNGTSIVVNNTACAQAGAFAYVVPEDSLIAQRACGPLLQGDASDFDAEHGVILCRPLSLAIEAGAVDPVIGQIPGVVDYQQAPAPCTRPVAVAQDPSPYIPARNNTGRPSSHRRCFHRGVPLMLDAYENEYVLLRDGALVDATTDPAASLRAALVVSENGSRYDFGACIVYNARSGLIETGQCINNNLRTWLNVTVGDTPVLGCDARINNVTVEELYTHAPTRSYVIGPTEILFQTGQVITRIAYTDNTLTTAPGDAFAPT